MPTSLWTPNPGLATLGVDLGADSMSGGVKTGLFFGLVQVLFVF